MIQLEVWGPYALFTRGEMKVERVSYDVPTPSAARGIVESLYYHPGIRWHIRRIYVLNPIEFTTIRRNEVKSKILGSTAMRIAQGKEDEPVPRHDETNCPARLHGADKRPLCHRSGVRDAAGKSRTRR